jgi:hypothetical protein
MLVRLYVACKRMDLDAPASKKCLSSDATHDAWDHHDYGLSSQASSAAYLFTCPDDRLIQSIITTRTLCIAVLVLGFPSKCI